MRSAPSNLRWLIGLALAAVLVAAFTVRSRGVSSRDTTPTVVLERQMRCLERAPQAAREAYERGLAACEAQNYPAGIAALGSAVAQAPDCALIHHNLGAAYAGAGRRAEARAAFAQALRLEPALAEAWLRMGLLQVEAQDYPAAEASLTRALALQPGQEQAELLLEHVYLLRGDLTRAEALARSAVQRQPASFAAVMALGDVLSRSPAPDHAGQALDSFRSAVKLSTATTDPEGLAHRRRGELALRLRQPQEAVLSLQTASLKAPLNPTSWYLLAQAYRAHGEGRRAAAASKRAQQVLAWASEVNTLRERLGQQPGLAPLYFRLAQVEVQRGRTAEAVDAYRAGLARDPDDTIARRALTALERSAARTP